MPPPPREIYRRSADFSRRSYRSFRDSENFNVWCSIILIVITCSLFFGLFFGLIYPEIVINMYYPTRCTIITAKIVPRNCCLVDCSGCSTAPASQSSCTDIKTYAENSLHPDQCSTNNTEQCFATQNCSNGPKCCARICSTCMSCSGSKVRTCTSYACNCICAHSTPNINCVISCNICYGVFTTVKYNNITASRLENFDQDLQKANTWFLEHNDPDILRTCWINPNNQSDFLWNVGYTSWKWVIFSIFGALPLFLNLWFFTYLFIKKFNNEIAFSGSMSIWIGLILPFVILLPIYTNSVGYIVCFVFIMITFSFGNVLLASNILQKTFILEWPTSILLWYTTFIIIPLCIFLPIILFSEPIVGIVGITISIFTSMMILLYNCYNMSNSNNDIPVAEVVEGPQTENPITAEVAEI